MQWGSEGGLRYRLLEGHAFDRLPASSQILLAHRGGRVVGCYVLAPQEWGLLRMLLAVSPDALGTGVGRALVHHVAGAFSEQNLAGTIEKTNRRSLELSEAAGYTRIGELEVRTFSRFQPKSHANIRLARGEEIPAIVQHLLAQGHGWFSPDHLRASELFVTPDLSSGMQLFVHTWSLDRLGLPTPMDTIARRMLPLFQVIPSRFRFATGHYWWGDPGGWARVMEHAMAALRLQSIVLTGDVTSPAWGDLRRIVDFGVVGTAMGSDGMWVTGNRSLEHPIHFTPLNAV